MVEYALTKDAQRSGRLPDAPKITVALERGQVSHDHPHERRHKVRHVHLARHGRGTGAPATLMWWPGGKMTGTVQHEGRIYSIRHMGGEMHAVVEMGEDRMPQEHAPMPPAHARQ